MRDTDALHSEVFGPYMLTNNSRLNHRSGGDSDPPPLVSLSNRSVISANRRGIHSDPTSPPKLCKAKTEPEVYSAFEHHCRYSFMRSQLSRILRDGDFDSDGIVLSSGSLSGISRLLRAIKTADCDE